MDAAHKVAFLRTGGGFPGIQRHAGMWRALEEAGIVATHLHGNSAGGIVSLLDAVGHDAAWAWALLESLTDDQLRDEVFAWRLRGMGGWLTGKLGLTTNYFLRHEPIVELLYRHCGMHEQILKPITVYATDRRTAEEVPLQILPSDTCGYRINAVTATMSISGVFPYRMLGGRKLTDGGTSNNCAVPSYWRDYDEVWLLIASGTRDGRDDDDDGSMLTNMLRNAWFYGRDQINDAVKTLGLDLGNLQSRGWDTRTTTVFNDGVDPRRMRVNALWPDFSDRGALRFTTGLTAETYRWARNALAEMQGAMQAPRETPF